MWILPSRGRPQNIARFIDAYEKTGASTPVWMRFDDDDPQQKYDIPHNWVIETGPRKPLSEIYNDFFLSHKNLMWYGFIADDVVPVTANWDYGLINLAKSDGMAVPQGGDTTGGVPHFVLGGGLVRSIGWLALPGLDRIYIDTVWGDIAKERNVLRFAPEIILEHRHFSNKKAIFDKTYKKYRKKEDKIVYNTWKGERNDNTPAH